LDRRPGGMFYELNHIENMPPYLRILKAEKYDQMICKHLFEKHQIADLFLHSYKTDFIQKLIQDKKKNTKKIQKLKPLISY
jgi:hypothetical protein